jgi:hypothetical protein
MQIVPREWLLDGLQHLEAFFLGLACVERREDVPRVLREEICCERLYVLWHL